MVCRVAAPAERRNGKRAFAQFVAITRRQLRALAVELLEARELDHAQSGPNLVDPIVEPDFEDIVGRSVALVPVPRKCCHRMRAEAARTLCGLLVGEDDHSTLAGRHVLVWEETEATGVTERPA